MKIKGFFKDIKGASRVEERRRHCLETADPALIKRDPIYETAKALHPGMIPLKVTMVKDVSPTARTYRLEPVNGKLPVFQAGQYIALVFEEEGKNGEKVRISRPYSISSAPFEARGENPFVEITIRNKGENYAPDLLFHHMKEGTVVKGSMPEGQFFYEPLRDAEHVVALAGGSGITPFYSMAREIENGNLNFDLTILYGSAKSDDIIFKEQLDAIKSDKVHVVHVLSDDPDWKGEKGFLTAELIKKYSHEDTSYFICGPQVMYNFLKGELDKMEIPRRRIRREVFGTPKDVRKSVGYPVELADKQVKLKVYRGVHCDEIPARTDETVVVALERAGFPVETRCRSGECGFCRSQLLKGDIYVSPDGDGRRAMDKELGWFHPCSSYPLSDITIKIPII